MDPATRRDTTRNTTSRYDSGYHSVANTRRRHDDFRDPRLAPGPRRAGHARRDGRRLPARSAATCAWSAPLAAAVAAPPSIRFEDYPTEVGKREIRISDAAARLANALHLHLD